MTTTNTTTLDQLLAHLVGFKTLSRDHAVNRKALKWIRHQLKGTSLHVEIIEIHGFPSLIATTSRTMSPRLWLQGHLDIVPGSDETLRLRIEDGKMIGRGTFDMKYAIASYIKLAQELGSALPQYDFGIMITTDEEIGGTHGVKALLEKGYTSEAAFLPDGGKDWQFVSASRGIWHLKATYVGESNHGSRPWLGKNAVVGLMRFSEELLALFPAEPCGVPNHFHHSINVGVLRGGEVTNQVPDLAEAQYDIRYVMEDGDRLKKAVHALTKKYPEITLHTLAEGNGYQVNRTDPFFMAYEALLREHGIEPSFEITHGSSDARYFTEHGIPTIVLRPAGGGHHSEYEWLDLDGFHLFHTILRQFIETTKL